jgi:ribonuclease T2
MGYRRICAGWKGVLLALVLPVGAAADGERAGDFDYYVAALSWSAAWCELEGDGRGEPQCDPGRRISFVLHGLWPQYEEGWPAFCRTVERDPSRGETAAVAEVFGGAGAAFYQWKKHGRCSGLPAADYYALARRVKAGLRTPPVLTEVKRPLTVPAEVIEGAFLEANPQLSRDMVTVTCSDELIAEVRVCLTRELQPRRCGDDVIRDCRLTDAVLLPVR